MSYLNHIVLLYRLILKRWISLPKKDKAGYILTGCALVVWLLACALVISVLHVV